MTPSWKASGRHGPTARLLGLILIGLIAGYLSGLFGVGGGVLIVPALVLALGFAQRRANGTSLAAVVPISIVGAIAYLVAGHIDFAVAGIVFLGSAIGAYAGVRLLHSLSDLVLRWVFIAFLIVVAIRLVIDTPTRATDIEFTAPLMLGLLALGLVTGTLSGLLGVGGGVIMVPILITVFEISDLVAKGVSLLVVIPTGIIATVLSTRRGGVDLRAAAIIGGGGALTALGGAATAFILPPAIAGVLFGAFLLVIAVRMAVAAVMRQRAGKE